MDKAEANERFQHADTLYRQERYDEALVELERLEPYYPDNHRILSAKARTLEHLARYQEAAVIYERLLDEFGYEKVRPRYNRVMDLIAGPEGGDGEDDEWTEPRRRFRIKPVRLILLILILIGMYFEYIPVGLGVTFIVAYFVVKYALRLLFSGVLRLLFSIPFKMKGKALAGATTQVHGYEWAAAPPENRDSADVEDDDRPKVPLRYVWIDVTITPTERTQGFVHWEPGELALAPLNLKYRSPDDYDKCFPVHEVRFVQEGQEQDDEGYKVVGPQRIKILAGVPLNEDSFKFAYYFETFGDIRLRA